jgi:hypothetical protein
MRTIIYHAGPDGARSGYLRSAWASGALRGSRLATLLEGAKQRVLTNSNSHLISETKITLGIYHGIGFEAESDTAHFSARIYMVGDTLYQTLALSPLG